VKTVLALAAVLAVVSVQAAAEDVRMLYIAQAGYQPRDIQTRAEEYRRETGREVKLSFAEYEDVYSLIIQSAAKAKADYDVVLADMIWMDDYASRGILTPVPEGLALQVRQGMVSAIHQPFEVDGVLQAYPFLANLQLFYVNRGLLLKTGFTSIPGTLEDMKAIATAAKRLGIIKYPLFNSWNKQEALVCEFTVMVGAFGGSLVDQGGQPRVDGPQCVEALRFMVSLLEEGLMNPYSLQSDEVFAADAFLKGDALFQTNWTFVTGLMQQGIYKGTEKLTAALIPVARAAKSTMSTTTVSGYQGLAVPENSTRKEEAWEFVEFLASPQFQRGHLSEMSVWEEVWNEERTRQIDPDIELKKAQLLGVVDRIRHPAYRKISLILQEAIYQALNRKLSPERALSDAQSRIGALE
jgi:multiple sugar transport system substrate-binding protein